MTLFHRFVKAIKPLLFRVWLITRGATLGVRAIVFDSDERVFLVRHTYLPGWYLPGGGVEAGQTVPEALRRELWEEGNIRLTGAPTLLGVYRNARDYRRDHVVLYLVRTFEQDGPRGADHEIAETGFFPLDALPDDTTPATLRRLSEVTGLLLEDGNLPEEW